MEKLEQTNRLYHKVKDVIIDAKSVVRKTVNYVILIQNWEIGRLIVEDEQGGEAKAEYGKYIIKKLSEKLTKEFGTSYSKRNLFFMRNFYLAFPIVNAVRSQLEKTGNQIDKKNDALRHKSKNTIHHAVRTKSHPLFNIISPQLSWTHYRSLLRVENPKPREFYINEAAENDWGTRALDRQINSFYYERLLSSQIFASKYKLYLPTEDELRQEIELQKHYFEKQL